jgi:hypothetical protein
MQQRRLRLGDILDDYCPRERRITNHAVVAMVEDEVKQTRCTTCDADHEYKQAKVPASRRRRGDELTPPASPAPPALSGGVATPPPQPEDPPLSALPFETSPTPDAPAEEPETPAFPDDEGPVHRPLIRATLPRPEGQAPERKAPDFTMRQTGGRFDQQRNGSRPRGRHGRPPAKGAAPAPQSRFGARPAAHAPRQGNRPAAPQQPRGGRPAGPNRGPRQGGGPGRKRGR